MGNIIERAADDIKSNIEKAEFEELKAHESYLDILTSQLDDIIKQSNVINDKLAGGHSRNDEHSSAMKLISKTQEALATAELLGAVLSSMNVINSAKNVASKAHSWVVGSLMPWLKNLMSAVWASIQTLITPKEWKIKGELGTSLLGLAKAELEISFGK